MLFHYKTSLEIIQDENSWEFICRTKNYGRADVRKRSPCLFNFLSKNRRYCGSRRLETAMIILEKERKCTDMLFNRKKYIQLLRMKHYIKNLLIFVPVFFGQEFFHISKLKCALSGFISFCLISSCVYILNDLKDVKKDRNHPVKRHRPIADGSVKKSQAIALCAICFCGSAVISLNTGYGRQGIFFPMIYFLLNVLYSFGLKDRPVIDIIILASGFVIRIFYGAFLTHTTVSGWLYLVVVTGSFYMGLGKRRNELKQPKKDTRDVLKYYPFPFLDKNMYVYAAMVNVFYALWAMELDNTKMLWTVPVFMTILMKYSLDIEGEYDGDPVEVLLHDKYLILISSAYGAILFLFLYIL